MTRENRGVMEAWAEQWRPRWFDEIVVNEVAGVGGDVADVSTDVFHPGYPGWIFHLTLSVHGAVVGFEVIASSDVTEVVDGVERRVGHSDAAPAITARWLRTLPLGEIEDAARRFHLERAAERRNGAGAAMNQALAHVIERHARIFAEQPRPGRRGRSRRAYAEVAAMYVELCRQSKRPVADLAKKLGYSYSQTSNILSAARRFGLLTAAPSGMQGGDLTEEALNLLNDEGTDDRGEH